jgi:hypothetical protein
MGKWLAVNGESIYATQPTLFGAEAGAFSTTEKDKNGDPSSCQLEVAIDHGCRQNLHSFI